MTIGLDKRFVAVDATPCTVFAAELATEPIVLPAVLATVLIDPVTVPTSCPGIASIPFNVSHSANNLTRNSKDRIQKHLSVLCIMKLKRKHMQKTLLA